MKLTKQKVPDKKAYQVYGDRKPLPLFLEWDQHDKTWDVITNVTGHDEYLFHRGTLDCAMTALGLLLVAFPGRA